jgi:GT2 family glycosyltransferase
MKKSWFTIIIANYNGEEYLPKCLKSVFKSKYKKFKVLVADDNSKDDSISIVKTFQKKHKNLSFIKSKKNQGPSGTRNVALKKVDTEYIYFLDNDTEVAPNWLEEIVRVFGKHSKAGAVQSLLVDFDDRSKIQNAGLKLIPQTGWAIGISDGKNIKSRPKKPTEILGLSAALAVKTEVIKKSVNFDRAFVHYTEDLDFSWRIWVAGYEIFLSPDSVVYHKVKKIEERKNVGANNEIVYFHLSKNALTSLTKNFNLSNLLFYLPQCFAILFVRALLVLIVRKDASSVRGTAKAMIWYVQNMKMIMKRRSFVQNKLRKAQDKDFFNKIMLPYNPLEIYKKYFSQTKLLPIK